jgi:histidinol phosphatase-like PHP family hydrolase
MPLANTDLSELLARRAGETAGHRARAYGVAARVALMWSEEASDVLAAGRSLTELERIGPSLARRIESWLEEDAPVPARPEVRRDFSSFAAARRVLAGASDRPRLRADLQMHTTFSDGDDSIEGMAVTGLQRGYEYIAITDHSDRGLRVVRGMDEETLARQGEEIDGLNAMLAARGAGLAVLKGLEMNIDEEGGGDMDPEALAGLDLVIGSFHSALRRAEDQTARYVAALRNPCVDLIGHPRGRKYDDRVGLVAEWRRVLEEAAAQGKALETNAYPDRQDLNREILGIAAELEVWISIGTDAHDTNEMRFVDVGVAAALEAGVRPERILNYLSREELAQWRQRRG